MRKFIFCISLSIIFSSLIFAQPIRDQVKKIGGNPSFTGFWTPANLPIDTTTTSVFFYGEAPRTKVAKDSGGVSVRPYMRVWGDTTEILGNNTFDSNINGWEADGEPETFEWVASGGGFTGAAHLVCDDIEGFGKPFSFYPQTKKYRLIVNMNITSSNTLVGFVFTALPSVDEIVRISSNTGVLSLDTIITLSSTYLTYLHIAELSFYQFDTGASEFYVDNVSFKTETDSIYGFSYPITRPADTTTYYYSQSIQWRQKDKNTIWLAAETDTVIIIPKDCIPTTLPSFTDIIDAELSTVYQSDSLVISGLVNCSLSLSIEPALYSAEYRIGALGDWKDTDTTVSNNDSVWVRVTSSDLHETETYAILTIDNIERTFAITTMADLESEGTYTIDGNELYTSDGNRLYAKP